MVQRRSYHLSGAIHKREPDRPIVSPATLLVCIWLAGMLFGIAISFLCRTHLMSVLPLICPVFFRVHHKIFLALLPFLLSAFAVHFSNPAWLFWICGIKSTLFSFCCVVLCLCYGQAGWLARWIFLFLDVCSLPLLFFYWLRNLRNRRGSCWYEHIILLLALIALILLDYRIVTPYGAKFGIF